MPLLRRLWDILTISRDINNKCYLCLCHPICLKQWPLNMICLAMQYYFVKQNQNAMACIQSSFAIKGEYSLPNVTNYGTCRSLKCPYTRLAPAPRSITSANRIYIPLYIWKWYFILKENQSPLKPRKDDKCQVTITRFRC